MKNDEKCLAFSLVLYRTDPVLIDRLLASICKVKLKNILFVIDNSETDQLKDKFAGNSGIEYIHTNKNLGYGRAHNIALKRTIDHSKYHIILNPDICFKENTIEKLIEFMNLNPKVGLLMPKVTYPDGKLQHLCKFIPTPWDLIRRRFIPNGLITERKYDFEYKFSNYGRIMDVPYLSGCFMCIRTDSLKETGLFDERFFMYGEDVDLSRRMNEKYRTVYYPDVTIIHDHAKESYKSLKMLLIHIVNMIKYFNKWGWLSDPKRKIQNKKALESFYRPDW